ALLRFVLATCAHKTEHPIRPLRMCGPDFGAVQKIVIAIAVGAHLQRREIRARPRLRIPWHHSLSDERIGGRCSIFCSGVPNAMMTGATIFGPIGMEIGHPAEAISTLKI